MLVDFPGAFLGPARRSVLAASLLSVAGWASDQSIQPGTYEVTARIEMPHLEENLRDTITRERRCLSSRELHSVFPVLRQEAFAGCDLVDERREGGAIRYLLACRNPQGASGIARLETSPGRLAGVLEVKMGGKNMTFAQRIEATRLGECIGAP